MTITISLNGSPRTVAPDTDPDMPLLWWLRDHAGLTGTKFGCGMGLCGACTVQLDGEPVRSCQVPIGQVGSRRVKTIEGLSRDGSHPVQRAWRELRVPQCGYCQSGQMMTCEALLRAHPHPTREEAHAALVGNICRCGTYERIERAVQRAAELAASEPATKVGA